MKVILQENMEGVGVVGDLLEVADGFARNYLLPRRKAMVANLKNMKELEHAKRVAAEKARKEKAAFEEEAKKLSSISLTLSVKVGKEGKLFGSVTSKDIAAALKEHGHEVDRRKIQLSQPIKELGAYSVPVRLHRDVTATIPVTVTGQHEEAAQAEEAATSS